MHEFTSNTQPANDGDFKIKASQRIKEANEHKNGRVDKNKDEIAALVKKNHCLCFFVCFSFTGSYKLKGPRHFLVAICLFEVRSILDV